MIRRTVRGAFRSSFLALALTAATTTSLGTHATIARGDAAAADPDIDPSSTLGPALQRLLNAPALAGTTIGVAVYDVATGKYLAVHGAHVPVNPASNAKLFTAAAALATLHGDHRFVTSLHGTVKDGGIDGNLVLRGFGDPSLTAEDLGALVADLKGRGVRRIGGDLLVDQRFFDGETTPPAFDQQPNEWSYFRAPVSAVAVDENTVTLTVRPGGAGGTALAHFDPPGFVDITGDIKSSTGAGDDVVLELSPSGQRLAAKLGGAIGEDAHVVRYTRRVADPSLLAGYVVKSFLDANGIAFKGDVKLGTGGAKIAVLARHESAPLSSILYSLGKASDNFYAEMVLKSLGGETHGAPARSADGADVVMKWLAKVGASDDGFVFKNGSGLFDADRVTPSSVVQLLRAAWKDPGIQPEYLAQLSIGGVDGTLHKRFHNHRVKRDIRAKTGTLEDVAALGGYVLRDGGAPPLAFSVIVNHAAGKVSGARAAMDAFVEAVAGAAGNTGGSGGANGAKR